MNFGKKLGRLKKIWHCSYRRRKALWGWSVGTGAGKEFEEWGRR